MASPARVGAGSSMGAFVGWGFVVRDVKAEAREQGILGFGF